MSTLPIRFIRFLPSFCFSRSLRLRRDVAAVALGDTFLRSAADGFAGDDLGADGGLDRDFELLARDQFPHLRDQRAAALVGVVVCTMIESASTGSPATRMSIFTMGDSHSPANW